MEVEDMVLENPFRIIPENNMRELLERAIEVLSKEPVIVDLEPKKALVVGDTHGDIESSINALRNPVDIFIFLGDYVDRGEYQIENIAYLLAYKLKYPDRIVLLRGNHETEEMNLFYGFYMEVMLRYRGLFDLFQEVFSKLPFVARMGRILMMHGGIPKGLDDLSSLKEMRVNLSPESPFFQILWNDPSELISGFSSSPRGEGIYLFGEDALEDFLKKNNADVLLRSHEFFPEGFRRMFSGKLISVFSCRFYGGTPAAALLTEKDIIKITLI